jgi:hypothetical protein
MSPMTRSSHRPLAGVTLAWIASLVACGAPSRDRSTGNAAASAVPSDAGTPASSASPQISPPLATSPSLDAGAPATVSTCVSPGAGEVSDDETPVVVGIPATAFVSLKAWLADRDVSTGEQLAWLKQHDRTDRVTNETDWASCQPLTVGDRDEPALLCIVLHPAPLTETRAVVVTVRNKRPAALLDVGLGIGALDWTDAHWLDLSLHIAKDGRSVELRDRAPEGTRLIAPPSVCRQREAKLEGCRAAFAKEPDPERFVLTTPKGSPERFDSFQGCFLARGPNGRVQVMPAPVPAFSGYPATLHDCAGGRVLLKRAMSDLPPKMRSEWKAALAFLDKSCAARGTWTWKGDRFMKSGK